MTMMRKDPVREMRTLRESIDRMFEDFMGMRLPAVFNAGSVDLDMYEEGDQLIVKASVPGYKPEDVNVTLDGTLLTVSGEMNEEKEEERKNYHMRERRTGHFERSVTLPYVVKDDGVDASYKDGTLTLRMPRANNGGGRRIPVKG